MRGKRSDCPVFIGSVAKDSPAAKAGLEPGDALVAVDGTPVNIIEDAAQRLSAQAAKPVTVTVHRGDTDAPITVVVQRMNRATIFQDNGLKVQDGRLVPFDTTEKELACLLRFDENRITGHQAFRSTHYPENLNLYYPGFEAFILDGPPQVSVGGIEQGPARNAGVRWGDVIVTIDGVSVAGKTASKLEDMLSSKEPKRMTIEIERCGERSTFSFMLERASDIMRRSQKQSVGGEVLPLGIPQKYLSCFM